MVDYGLKIWNSSGNAIFDASKVTTRLVYSHYAVQDETDSVTLSYINGRNTIQFAVVFAIAGSALAAAPHNVTRAGNTITWTARSSAHAPSSACNIIVFVYD